MAGYYPELRQMVRIYPLNICTDVKARHFITAEVERNPRDSRYESWALKDRDNQTLLLGQKCEDSVLESILKKEVVPDVDVLNERRASLGILQPANFRIELKTRNLISNPQQVELFDDFKFNGGFKTAGQYFLAPYVIIPSEASQQCFQLREWGLYELMRKYEQMEKPITASLVENALRIKQDRNVYFVVGNMNHNRTIWIVIKVFCFDKRIEQGDIFQ